MSTIEAAARVKNIEDRLPSIMGWLSESNTFRLLSKACNANNAKFGRKIGIIRGSYYCFLRSLEVLTIHTQDLIIP
jgi:hypothetical protein